MCNHIAEVKSSIEISSQIEQANLVINNKQYLWPLARDGDDAADSLPCRSHSIFQTEQLLIS